VEDYSGAPRQARRLTEKDTIVLGDFANSTGDAVFDGTLREGLFGAIAAVTVSDSRIRGGDPADVANDGTAANVRLTPQIAREVCQRTNSTAALDGSIALIGARYDLIVKAVNCVNGDCWRARKRRRTIKPCSGRAEHNRFGNAQELGESLEYGAEIQHTLEQATTPSLEALQAFSLGVKATFAGDDDVAAVASFQNAIRLDPNFAAAFDAMGNENQWIGTALAVESIRKAFELRTRVSERRS